MEKNIQEKIKRLKNIISSYENIAVAFSGGVDSSFLLKISSEALGKKCIAFTFETPAHLKDEINQAKKIAQSLNVKHIIIPVDLTELKEFQSNTFDRCYHCKKFMFSKLKNQVKNKGIEYILEGSNSDDLNDYRPGMKALQELDIKSPLIEAGLNKSEIREISKQIDLPTWDKPANPCLATRIPYGETISKVKLKQVKEAEKILHNIGINELRVRNQNNIARIEVKKTDYQLILDNTEKIIKKFKELGFTYITLDVEGFRSGSLNEVI